MKPPRVRVEDLLFPKLQRTVNEVVEEQIQWKATHETAVTPALQPLLRAMFHPHAGAEFTFGVMTRTAILFAIDHGEFVEAVSSAGPLLPELPPLPFPRVAVECMEDTTWALMAENGVHYADLELFLINESTRGEEWTVVQLMREALPDGVTPEEATANQTLKQHLLFYSLHKSGEVTILESGAEQRTLDAALQKLRRGDVNGVPDAPPPKQIVLAADSPEARSLQSIPLEFAHLVSARGVTVEQVAIPRQQRRSFTRKRWVHPTVYLVHIGDGTADPKPGRGEREYHCRWMVRGHWRHLEDGRTVWVRPYIKGPAGAPWKGRPIYVVDPVEDAA